MTRHQREIKRCGGLHMCIAKGVVAPFFKWILGIIRDYPVYDERELDFWLACFNSWFIVCKIL